MVVQRYLYVEVDGAAGRTAGEVYLRNKVLPDSTYLGHVQIHPDRGPDLRQAEEVAVDAGWDLTGADWQRRDSGWVIECQRDVPLAAADPASTRMPRIPRA